MRRPEISVEVIPFKGNFLIRHVTHKATKYGYTPVAEYVGIDGYWTRNKEAANAFQSPRLAQIHLRKYLPRD